MSRKKSKAFETRIYPLLDRLVKALDRADVDSDDAMMALAITLGEYIAHEGDLDEREACLNVMMAIAYEAMNALEESQNP
jgi:hypothetical protein